MTAAKCGVSVLKFGDLEVHFFSPPGSASQAERLPSLGLPEEETAPAEMGQQGSGSQVAPSMDQSVLEELAESQKLIDDPSSFEQEFIDRLLGNDAGIYEASEDSGPQ